MRKFLLLTLIISTAGCSSQDWRSASREPAGIAYAPENFSDAVIEVYAADAYSWRGWFAVHTWIAVKPQDAPEYTVYEVTGWRVKSGLPALREYTTPTPDRYWYGANRRKSFQLPVKKPELCYLRCRKPLPAIPGQMNIPFFRVRTAIPFRPG